MSDAELTVLLAEDDDGHATLIQRHLVRAGLVARFLRARNGRETLDLFGQRDRDRRGRFVVLLDIRMPGIDGIEVLRILKSGQGTCAIPIYMLTTTDDPRDVERCFELGCNAYLTKPTAPDQLVDTIRKLASFLQIGALPEVPLLAPSNS